MKLFLVLSLFCMGTCCFAQSSPLIKFENPKGMPPTNGYSHAAVVDLGQSLMIIMSGQVALDSTGKLVGPGDLGVQTTQVFNNIKKIVSNYGGDMSNIVKLSYYLVNGEEVPAVRKARDQFINIQSPPASTLVVVKQLFRSDILIEIEATAVIAKK